MHHLVYFGIEFAGDQSLGVVGVVEELIIEGEPIVLKEVIAAHAPFQSL